MNDLVFCSRHLRFDPIPSPKSPRRATAICNDHPRPDMNHSTLALKPLAAAILLASLAASALGATAAAVPPAAASAAAARVPVAMQSPNDWIQYDDITFTPVADEVSRRLAAAGAGFDTNDNAKAAAELRAAADALQGQMAEAVKETPNARAVADQRLTRAIARLRAVATSVAAGQVTTRLQFDKAFDPALRADLDSRWVETDYTTWYPVSDESHRHFEGAMEAYAKKDEKTAAAETRRGVAYLRLEEARATGVAKHALDRSISELDRLAGNMAAGSVQDGRVMGRDFARADNALALEHRERAASSWSEKKFDAAGYELKAGAQDLANAATWMGDKSKAVASDVAGEARDAGDKLASGAAWTKNEVEKSLHSLGHGIERLGHDIDAEAHRAADKVSS